MGEAGSSCPACDLIWHTTLIAVKPGRGGYTGFVQDFQKDSLSGSHCGPNEEIYL